MQYSCIHDRFPMSTSPQSQPDSEFIIANGDQIPVSRNEMRSEIHACMQAEGISQEEAWERVKTDLAAFIETGSFPNGWGKGGRVQKRRLRLPQNQVTDAALFDASKQPAQIEQVPADSAAHASVLPIIERAQPDEGGAMTAPAQASGTSDAQQDKPFSLSDDLLPEHLKGTGIPVMDAIIKGQVKLPGEHPDAELLRASLQVAAQTFANPNTNIEDHPVIKQIHERQMLFPFKMPQSVRIMSTDFNQTSLFHVASNNMPRRFFKNEIMGRIGENVTIFFYGEELRHEDEAIFLQLIHMARGKAPYEWIYVENVPFFRGAKGATRILGAKDTNSIDESLERMRGAYVMIRNAKRKVFITVNLIRDLQGSGSERRIMIDPCMVALLDSYTAMDQDVLYTTKGVARQLFKYISTKPHSGLYPTKVQSFFELCYGSMESITKHYRERNPEKTDAQVKVAMTKKISDFRRKALPEALGELKKRGLIVTYTIDEAADKVAIIKNPSSHSFIGQTPPQPE